MLKIRAHYAPLPVSIILIFAALPACAQEFHRAEGYVAFSYAHVRLDTETAVFAPTSRNYYGIQTGLKLNLYKNIGIMVFDGGFQWGGTNLPSPGGTQLRATTRLGTAQVLFGPEFTFRSRKVDLFGHSLVGVSHTGVVVQLPNTSVELTGTTHLAFGAGGGVDYNLTPVIGLRVAADYIPTRVSGSWENDFRSCTGIVVRF